MLYAGRNGWRVLYYTNNNGLICQIYLIGKRSTILIKNNLEEFKDMKKFKDIMLNTSLIIIVLLVCIFATETVGFVAWHTIASAKGKKNVEILLHGRETTINSKDCKGNETQYSKIEVFPYYLYRNSPYTCINGRREVNSEGYRNGSKEFGPKQDGIVRILAIGGSTTYGWLLEDYRQSWPSQLEKILNQSFPNKIEVINAGLPAGTSAESLIAFMLKDKYLEPDIVIFHNGGNDSVLLRFDEYYPDYRYYHSVSGGHQLRPQERPLLENSYFIKYLYSLWFRRVRLDYKLETQSEDNITLEQMLTNTEKHDPVGYRRNMSSMIEQTLSMNAVPIIFPFHLADKKIYSLVEKEYRYVEKVHEAAVAGLAKDKSVLRELAKKYNVPYYELGQNDIPLEYFVDHCHLKEEGDSIKANYMAQKLIPIIKHRATTK